MNSSLRMCNNRKRKNDRVLWSLNVYIGAGDEGYLPSSLSNKVIMSRMGSEIYENSTDRFALARNT